MPSCPALAVTVFEDFLLGLAVGRVVDDALDCVVRGCHDVGPEWVLQFLEFDIRSLDGVPMVREWLKGLTRNLSGVPAVAKSTLAHRLQEPFTELAPGFGRRNGCLLLIGQLTGILAPAVLCRFLLRKQVVVSLDGARPQLYSSGEIPSPSARPSSSGAAPMAVGSVSLG